MNNFKQWLNTNIGLLVLIGFLLMSVNSCNQKRAISAMDKRVTLLTKSNDSLGKRIAKEVQIEGLRSSKRTLYDWNAVVRSAVRPDDRMNEYDKEIKVLENQ